MRSIAQQADIDINNAAAEINDGKAAGAYTGGR